jgi:hypothetical protein
MTTLMTSPVLWVLIAFQLAMGLFDIVYHHELTERLAWRPSQRHELKLHGARNLLYALLFLARRSPCWRPRSSSRSWISSRRT